MAVAGVVVNGPPVPGSDRVLTDDALAFVADLQRRFGRRRLDLLQRREERQAALAAGGCPTSCPAPRRSARPTGRSPRRRPTSTTVGWRSPARPSRR